MREYIVEDNGEEREGMVQAAQIEQNSVEGGGIVRVDGDEDGGLKSL